ncbi:MAG: hypothetical protein J6Y94_04215 [Bacteriovoracaceae bacterium]|nr:hypothetical protein [Bacteriovoracaceae bacterium]
MAVDFSNNIPGDYPTLDRLRRHYERKLDLEKRDHQENVDRLTKNYNSSLEQAKKDHAANEAVLQRQMEQNRDNYDQQRRKLNQRLETMTEDFRAQSEDQRHEFASRVNQLNEEYDQAKTDMKTEKQKALAERDELYNRKIKDLSVRQQQALQKFMDDVNDSLDEDRNTLNKYKTNLKNQQAFLRNAEQQKHAEDIQNLRGEMARRDVKHAEDVRDMRHQLKQTTNDLNTSHENALKKVRENYQGSLATLKQEMADRQAAHGEALADYANRLEEQQHQHQKQIDYLNAQHEQDKRTEQVRQEQANNQVKLSTAHSIAWAEQNQQQQAQAMRDSYEYQLKNAIDDHQNKFNDFVHKTEENLNKLRTENIRRQGEQYLKQQQELFDVRRDALAQKAQDRQNYDRFMQEVREQHKTAANDLEQRHRQKEERLKATYQSELDEVRDNAHHQQELALKRYKQDKQKLHEEKNDAAQEMSASRQELARNLNRQIEKQKDAMQEIKNQNERNAMATQRAHELQNQHLLEQIENLERKNLDDRNKLIQEMQHDMEVQIGQIRNQYQQVLDDDANKYREKINQLRHQNEIIGQTYKNEIARFNQRQEELSTGDNSGTRKAMANLRKDMRDNINRLNLKVKEARYQAQENAQKDIYQLGNTKDVERVEAQMDQRIKNNQAMSLQKSNYQKKLNNLANALENTELETQHQLKDAQERYANSLATIAADNNRQRAYERINNHDLVAAKSQAYEEKIDALNRSYENLLREQQRDARRTLLNQKNEYEKKISDLNKAHAQELNTRLKEAENKRVAMEQELRSQNNYTTEIYERKLAKMKQAYARYPEAKKAF